MNARLVGYLPSSKEFPSFATPLYMGSEVDAGLYLSLINDDRIEQFVKVDVLYSDDAIYCDLSTNRVINRNEEEEAIYIYNFNDGNVLIGSKNELKGRLHKLKSKLKKYPYSLDEVDRFIDDYDFFSYQPKAVVAERLIDTIQKYKFNDILLRDFNLNLIRFYRSFRKLSTISSPSRKRAVEYTYRASFGHVFPLIVDDFFLNQLKESFQKMDTQRNQLSLALEYRPRLTSLLTGCGISRKNADNFMAIHASSLKKVKYSKNLEVSDIRDYFLNIDHILANGLEEASVLARAEKKLKKRKLDRGSVSITYGVILLIRSESYRANFSDYSNTQLHALRAIKSGIGELISNV